MRFIRLFARPRLGHFALPLVASLAVSAPLHAAVNSAPVATLGTITAKADNPESLPRRVLGVTRLMTHELVMLKVDGETVETTPLHKFYVVGTGWISASALETGQRVEADNPFGYGTVQSVRTVPTAPRAVFNLAVETDHTFRVGKQGLLVHNGDCVLRPTQSPMFGRRPSLAAPPQRQLALRVRATEDGEKAQKSSKIAEQRARADKATVSTMNLADRSNVGAIAAGRGYYREGWMTSVQHMSGNLGVSGYRQADNAWQQPQRAFNTLAERRAGMTYPTRKPSTGFRSLETIGQRAPSPQNYMNDTMNHRVIAAQLKANGHTDESVMLATCKAGDRACTLNLAQRLSNKINAPVLAPTGYLNTNGKPFKLAEGEVWRLFKPGKPSNDPRRVETYLLKPGERPKAGEGDSAYRQLCFIPEPGQHCRVGDAPPEAMRQIFQMNEALPPEVRATPGYREPSYYPPTYGRYYPPDPPPGAPAPGMGPPGGFAPNGGYRHGGYR